MKKNGLRILKFQADSVKRLGVVQITPQGNIIQISGANGSGKTSVLDCIEYALRGTTNVPSKVIRNGRRSATIQLEFETFVVTRKFIESGRDVLQVMSKADRSIYPSPQSLLDGFMAAMSFDPLEFIRMKSKDQFLILRKLVKVDFDTFDADYKRDYDLRREVKKEYQAIEVRRDLIPVQPDLPLERRDEEALTRELSEASEFNANIEHETRQRAAITQSLTDGDQKLQAKLERITELQAEVARLQAEAKEDGSVLKNTRNIIAKWKPLPEVKNARDIADALNAARIVNAAVAKREQRDNLQAEVDALKERHQALGESLDQIQTAKTQAIAEAHFPVEGLGFGEDEVLWQGLPFNQISNADQIRASVAIGMALNPQIRVMRVKDGSLLDSKSMAIVAELAKSEDFQVWMEMVDETGTVGIFLEDGEVKKVNDESIVPEKQERDMRIDLPMPGAMTVEQLEPPTRKRGGKRRERV